MNKGLVYAAIAYLTWGLLPIYWKSLQALPPLEIMAHRVVWSLAFVAIVLTVRRQWRWLGTINRQTLLTFVAVSALISVNWFVYIWAVNAGFVVETSLGYFINPLVNVSLGAIFLGERLRRLQWMAVGLAAAGVLYLTISYGSLPWISLTLAFTFGFYALLKKTAKLNSAEGLTLEMALIFPLAVVYLIYLGFTGEAAFPRVGLGIESLMVGAGVITAIPLLAFASAARRISMTALGLMQYMAPTMQFCLGVFLYHEPFTSAHLVGFSLIWLALAAYTAESIVHSRQMAGGREQVAVSR
ncbi:MAG: EamA family transporter RarD [Caldilineaceae bacterium]|nr:EamA family transporter RarD [Caldilineaceae bacterium]